MTARPATGRVFDFERTIPASTDADTVVLDTDFGFTFLASVDLTGFDLLESASLRLPDGEELLMDDLGDLWSLLDVADTLSSLDDTYTWGDYFLVYETVNDGDFSCLVSLPETPLPPKPRLVNFADVQSVDTAKALTLTWELMPSALERFGAGLCGVLVRGRLFHADSVSQARWTVSRSVTIPPIRWILIGLKFEPGVTRLVSTKSVCYPDVQGVGARSVDGMDPPGPADFSIDICHGQGWSLS